VPYEFKLPDLGEGLTEGEIARWLVAEGDEIAEDAPLVEIATDKTTVEIPSPAAGLVSKIFVAEGDIVPVGTVLVVIGGDPGEPPVAPSAAPAGRVQATPLVRRVAQDRVHALGAVDDLRDRQIDADARERERVVAFELVLALHEVEHRLGRERRGDVRRYEVGHGGLGRARLDSCRRTCDADDSRNDGDKRKGQQAQAVHRGPLPSNGPRSCR